jgi:hypothetical protein
MPDDDRLRELQRRAYGPGGGLSEAEAVELAQLRAAGRAASAPVVPAPVAPAAFDTAPVSSVAGVEMKSRATVETGAGDALATPAPVETGAGGAGEEPAGPESTPSLPARSVRKKRILLAVVALACALLIGLGAGWLLFGHDGAPAMTAAQQKAWTEFEASGKYDAGSIRMVGEKYGVTAWYATKKDLDLECIMLTPAPTDTVGCAATPDSKKDDEGYWGQLSVQLELDKPKGAMVQAAIVRDTRGEPVAVLDRWNPGPEADWTNMFHGPELDIAKVIVKETGADGNYLRIIGYDDDTPIWLDQGPESCIYIADLKSVTTKECGLDFTTVGAMTRIETPGTAYVMRVTDNGPVVTVVKGVDPMPSDPQ